MAQQDVGYVHEAHFISLRSIISMANSFYTHHLNERSSGCRSFRDFSALEGGHDSTL